MGVISSGARSLTTEQLATRAAKAAGLFTLVTPSYWTRTEDFSGADLVLPSLGSPERPLMPRAVSLLGNSMVGIREINRHLSAVSDLLAH